MIVMRNNTQKPIDCASLSASQIYVAICSEVNRANLSIGNLNAFYAGICKDVEDNMKRHGNDSYVALCDCGTREKAGEVETMLGKFGLDVGERPDNGGDEETTMVYVILKDENFRP